MNDGSIESIFEEFKLTSTPVNVDRIDGVETNTMGGYARNLRVLGQLFEGLSPSTLHVTVFNRCFRVHGLKQTGKATPTIQQLWSRLGVEKIEKSKTLGNSIVCEFTEEDLKLADTLYKKFRQNSPATHVENRLSEIFRGIGYFIDIQEMATLKCFSVGSKHISIDYLTTDNELKHVEKPTDAFYDLWLQVNEQDSQLHSAQK